MVSSADLKQNLTRAILNGLSAAMSFIWLKLLKIKLVLKKAYDFAADQKNC